MDELLWRLRRSDHPGTEIEHRRRRSVPAHTVERVERKARTNGGAQRFLLERYCSWGTSSIALTVPPGSPQIELEWHRYLRSLSTPNIYCQRFPSLPDRPPMPLVATMSCDAATAPAVLHRFFSRALHDSYAKPTTVSVCHLSLRVSRERRLHQANIRRRAEVSRNVLARGRRGVEVEHGRAHVPSRYPSTHAAGEQKRAVGEEVGRTSQ